MKIEDLIKLDSLSKKDKLKLGLLAAATIILVIILIANYRSAQKKVSFKGAAKGREVALGRTRKLKGERSRKEKPAEIQALLKEVGREDPFLQPSEKKISRPARAKLVLSGIVSNGERSLAIINDMLVGEGDMIEDKKVIKIDDRGVVIKNGEKEYRLRLGGYESQKGGK